MVVNPVSGSGSKKAMIGWDGEIFFGKAELVLALTDCQEFM